MKNVILITIDALRADHLSFMGYSRNTSPFLDKISKEGTVFVQAFANSSWTAPAFAALFSSDYPVLGEKYGIEGRVVLQEVLKKTGYQTAAFHSNPLLSRYQKYDRGFDYFEDYLYKWTPKQVEHINTSFNKQAAKVIYKYNGLYSAYNILRTIKDAFFPSRYFVAAPALNTDLISWLEYSKEKPFFAWVHYMEPHAPSVYAPSRHKFQGSLNKDELKKHLYRTDISTKLCINYIVDLIDKYDSRIRYLDNAIGNLFAYLEENRILDNTLIIITADHGEEFLEHGSVGHPPKLYDELIHVPLIMNGPDIPKGKKIDKPVQHLDIAPTILDTLGFPVPETFLGKNVFKETERHGIISEVSNKWPHTTVEIDLSKLKVAYRTKEWKYIYNENADDELYNLRIDPKETRNTLTEQKEKAVEFKSIISQHLAIKRKILRVLNEKKKIKELKRKGRV